MLLEPVHMIISSTSGTALISCQIWQLCALNSNIELLHRQTVHRKNLGSFSLGSQIRVPGNGKKVGMFNNENQLPRGTLNSNLQLVGNNKSVKSSDGVKNSNRKNLSYEFLTWPISIAGFRLFPQSRSTSHLSIRVSPNISEGIHQWTGDLKNGQN